MTVRKYALACVQTAVEAIDDPAGKDAVIGRNLERSLNVAEGAIVRDEARVVVFPEGLRAPSVPRASRMRCAQANTIGFSVPIVRCRKNAVSSTVKVPWVTTIPSIRGSSAAPATAWPISNHWAGRIDPLRTRVASTASISAKSASTSPTLTRPPVVF